MKLAHLFYKFFQRVKTEGIKEILKESIYFNRIMVAIEKDITSQPAILKESMTAIIIDQNNYMDYKKKYDLRNVEYYCKRGAQCCMIFDNDNCVGYQMWTVDSRFKDLIKLNIRLHNNEAYEFDLFVYSEFRGTNAPKILTIETDNYLASKGIKKIYGFYFQDNLKALWWHRAYLKCREIKRIRTHRFLVVDLTNGKLMFNI